MVLTSSFFLFAVAVAGNVLRFMTPGPDALGYVGGMMRKNSHTPLPLGGTTLDGPSFARAMGDIELRLADVSLEGAKVGYIALTSSKGQNLRTDKLYC